jgi:hypothetical protein
MKLVLVAMLAIAGCSATTIAPPADAARIRMRSGVTDRREYVDQAEQEHDRAALMMILTTSRVR